MRELDSAAAESLVCCAALNYLRENHVVKLHSGDFWGVIISGNINGKDYELGGGELSGSFPEALIKAIKHSLEVMKDKG